MATRCFVPASARLRDRFLGAIGILLAVALAVLPWGAPRMAQATVGAPESDPAAKTETVDFGPHISIVPSSEYADDPLRYPDRFVALQLFKGVAAEETTGLSDIAWGASIDPKALLKALADSKLPIGPFNEEFTDSAGEGVDGGGEAAELKNTYGESATLGKLFRTWAVTTRGLSFKSDDAIDEDESASLEEKVSARDLAVFLATMAQVSDLEVPSADNTPFPYDSPYSASRVAAAFAIVATSDDCRAKPAAEGVNSWTSRALYGTEQPQLAKKDEAADVHDAEGSAWVVAQDDKKLPSGYYLVCDQSATQEDATLTRGVSEPILVVVGPDGTALYAKTDIPTVAKAIVNADDGHGGATVDTADSISSGKAEKVQFQLTGTLPENIGSYTLRSDDGNGHYAMTFIDTLGEALKADPDSVEVYLGTATKTPGAGAERVFIETGRADEKITVSTGGQSGEELRIAIDNVFSLYQADEQGALGQDGYSKRLEIQDYTAGAEESVLYVLYSASVEGDAATHAGTTADSALENSAVLEYSNDPTTDGKGTSTPAETQCYTYGVDIVKQDESKAPLVGAGFSLFRAKGTTDAPAEADDSSDIALFKRTGNGTTEPYCYSFAEWHTPVKSDGALAATLDSGYSETDSIVDGDGYYQICPVSPGTSSVDGVQATLQWRGLDAGAYTLKETATPSGYDTISPYTWTISAAETTASSTLAMAPIAQQNERADVSIADFEDGIGTLTVADAKAPLLPLTGGAGIRVALAVGTALIVAAIVIGALQRRRRRV